QTVNVSLAQNQPTSILTLYHRLIELRRAVPALSIGDFAPLPADDDLMAYIRKTAERRLPVVLNLNAKPKCFSMSELQCGCSPFLLTYLYCNPGALQKKVDFRADEGAIVELL